MKFKAFAVFYVSMENEFDYFQVFKMWEWTAEILLYVYKLFEFFNSFILH